MTVPLVAQIQCVQREIVMRERVYPKWVAAGRLRQADADREIAAMRAVLDSLLAWVVPKARALSEWHEDVADVLWWRFPIAEPPYVGQPIDSDWPGYHTHFTLIALPPTPTP